MEKFYLAMPTGQNHSNLSASLHRKELGLTIKPLDDKKSLELTCLKPIKGVILQVKGQDVKWSDQAIDLVPDDPQVVEVVGLDGRKVSARYLGDRISA